MAAAQHNKGPECDSTVVDEGTMETTGRGLFDLFKKKKEQKPEEVITSEFDKVQGSEPEPKVEEPKEEQKKEHGVLAKLHLFCIGTSSSSSIKKKNGEEEKKKKGLKEMLKGKISREKKEDTGVANEDPTNPKEKQGFMKSGEEEKGLEEVFERKISGEKKEDTGVVANEDPTNPKEKKGFMHKIKDNPAAIFGILASIINLTDCKPFGCF